MLGRQSKKRKILLLGSCPGWGGIVPMLTEHLGNEYEIASIFRPNAPLAIVTRGLEKLGNELTK